MLSWLAAAGVSRPVAYGSVALSLGGFYLAAMLLVVAGLPLLASGDGADGSLWVIPLLVVGLVVLHPKVLGPALGLVERLVRRPLDVVVPPWRDSALLIACYVPAWLAIGTATWAVARALDPTADWAPVATAAVLSWIVGFVLVPVPGGLGVREAAFVAAAATLDPGIAAATAILVRGVFVVVDSAGALVGAAALGMRRSHIDDLAAADQPSG